MKPWYQRTYLWGQVNITEDDPVNCDIEFWKSYWKDSGVEGVIINCGGIVSYYKSKFTDQYRAQSLGDTDYFRVWNDAARELNLSVIARMDINSTSRTMYEKYPEWYCKEIDGSPIMSQGRYVTCVNGGYYQQFIPEVFREIIEAYHPDGFADNSWAGLGWNQICYCDNCKDLFKKEYGLELPLKVDWDDTTYRTWIKWNYSIRIRNWEYYNQVTKRIGGEDCRWFGMLNADPFQTGGRFYDIKELIKDAEFIFCDHQSRDELSGFQQNSLNGALLRLASSENNIVAESMAHYYKGLRTFRLTSATEQETRKWMLSGISGGIAPWFHFVGGGTMDRRKLEISKSIYHWHKKNREYLIDRKNIANVGVVWNQESTIYYGRSQAQEKSAYPFVGFTVALSKAGIPFVPIHADDIGKYEDRLDTLILPNVAILSEKQKQSILEWISRGKNLILTGVTGCYDAEGEWAGNSEIHQVLGIELDHTFEGTLGNSAENWLNHEAHSYLKITKDHSIFSSIGDTDILPFGGMLSHTSSKGYLEKLCSLIPAFPIYPPEFAWIREESELGGVYAGVLESGSRVVFLAADIDRCYAKYKIPDHQKMLEGCVRWASSNHFPVVVEAPAHVVCNSYVKDDELIIELVNLAGCNVELGTLTENLPIGPCKVVINRPVHGEYAVGLVSGEKYRLFGNEKEVWFDVPKVGENELIVVKN